MTIIEASIVVFLLLVVVFAIIFNFFLMVYFTFFYILGSVFLGAFFASTKQDILEDMILLSDVKPGEKAIDLGSGDGRLVIALAKRGIEAHGYEINPFLVRSSKKNIKDAGLEGKAFIHFGNFWPVNFSEFDVVTVFGISHMMKRLEAKLKKELKPGARVVSNHFVFPNWPHAKKENNVRLYIK